MNDEPSIESLMNVLGFNILNLVQEPEKQNMQKLKSLTISSARRGKPSTGTKDAGSFIIASGTSAGNVDLFSIAQTPTEHPTLGDATQEAERLALKNPGKSFVVLQVVGAVTAGGVQW